VSAAVEARAREGREAAGASEHRLAPPAVDWVFAGMAMGWTAVIFIVNSRPAQDLPDIGWQIPHFDKLAHFGIYGVLAFLAHGALAPLWRRPVVRWPGAIVIGIVALTGLVDELQQLLRPGRQLDAMDWLANVLGAAAAVLVAKLVWAWRRRQRW
jgi:peptidoglycan/LPS O-acetylase OafA/YrhL